VEGWSNGTGVRIQNKGHGAGMLGREAHVHRSLGARLPARNLFTIGNRFVQEINRTTPNMEVMKLTLFPTGTGKQINWSNTSGDVGNVIV
jgi:hypothetical protein